MKKLLKTLFYSIMILIFSIVLLISIIYLYASIIYNLPTEEIFSRLNILLNGIGLNILVENTSKTISNLQNFSIEEALNFLGKMQVLITTISATIAIIVGIKSLKKKD